jgi:hypothetical protein
MGRTWVKERRRWQQQLPSSVALAAGRLQDDAVLAGPLLGSNPPWSCWEAEMQKHSRPGNLRHALYRRRWPQTLSGGAGQGRRCQRRRWEDAEGGSDDILGMRRAPTCPPTYYYLTSVLRPLHCLHVWDTISAVDKMGTLQSQALIGQLEVADSFDDVDCGTWRYQHR